MMTRKFGLVLVVTAALGLGEVYGQEQKTEHILTGSDTRQVATVQDMSWITGSWTGEALGGVAEEVWSEPSSGTMLGMFKFSQGGSTIFSELMSIVPDGDSIELILKHFNADLTGWEEKDEVVRFPLIKLEEGLAHFDGLTMHRTGPDALSIYVLNEGKDGSVSELVFNYVRK